MHTETFRATQGSRASIQRRFCACLLAALVAGFCTHSAKAAFEDDSASCGSGSDWTGTDGAVSSDAGPQINFSVDCHVSGGDVADASLTGGGAAVDLGDLPVMFDIDCGGDAGGSSCGGSSGSTGVSTGGASSSSFSINNTSVVIPEPGSIGVMALGGLGLLARCRRNVKRFS
jgi:hypothetical protein